MRNLFKGGSAPSIKRSKTELTASSPSFLSLAYDETAADRTPEHKCSQGTRDSKESVASAGEGRRRLKSGLWDKKEESDVTEREASNDSTPVSKDMRCYSWSSSTAMPLRKPTAALSPLHTAETSSVTEKPSINMEEAINLLQELRKVASPEDLVALRKFKTFLFSDCCMRRPASPGV